MVYSINDDDSDNSQKPLDWRQKIIFGTGMMQPAVSKLFAPMAGAPLMLGTNTTGYFRYSPEPYQGFTGQQNYGLLGMAGGKNPLQQQDKQDNNGQLGQILQALAKMYQSEGGGY